MGPSLATAQLLGWLLVWCVSLGFTLASFPPARSTWIRFLHLEWELGQHLCLGLCSWLAVWLWRRHGRRRERWAFFALWAVALIVCRPVLGRDLSLFASKIAVVGPAVAWLWGLCAAAALGLTVAAFAAARARRWFLRAPLLLGGLALASGNHVVLQHDYHGVHFVVAWAAALLIAGALARSGPERALSVPGAVLRLAAAGLAIWAVSITPPNAVAIELFRSSGSVVAPLLARLRAATALTAAQGKSESPWFRSRADQPPTLPSKPPLPIDEPIVLVLTVDCLRADLLERQQTADRLPTLRRLRDESAYFTHARTTAPATTQAVASLLTSTYYSQLYWTPLDDGQPLYVYPHEDDTPRFPELLQAAGVATLSVQGLPGITKEYGLVRGIKERSVVKKRGDFAGVREMVPEIHRLLAEHHAGPAFLFAHFADPHAPYDRGGTEGTPFERYLAEVELVDRGIGDILRRVEDLGLAGRTIVIVSADHGEAFGEHRTQFHATTMYDELLRVPLLIRVPGVAPVRVKEPVSLVDIGPTILDVYGIAAPGHAMGQSLLSLIRGGRTPLARPLAFESSRGQRGMVFRDGLKVIVDVERGTAEVFDLHRDPGELQNLYDALGPVARERVALVQQFFDAHRHRRAGYEVPYAR